MDLLAGEEMIWEGHPTWRSILSFYIKWTVVALLPLAVIIIANVAGASWPVWVGIVVFLGGFGLLLLIGWVRRHFTRYRITTKHLLIRTGILSRTENSASIDRVQNIKVIQSPVERLLRTGSVDFDTAGGDVSDAELRFVGINNPRDLRDQILAAVEKIRVADRQGGLG
jgi:uncharacterized membrane protein YdbT with pleckstrin-like domain